MLDKVMNSQNLAILYESPHRLIKLLEEINKIDENKIIFLTKELTKKFQGRYKGFAKDILTQLNEQNIKGEWVVIIEPKISENSGIITYDDIIDLKLPPKQKAKLISKLTGQNIKDIYNSLIS